MRGLLLMLAHSSRAACLRATGILPVPEHGQYGHGTALARPLPRHKFLTTFSRGESGRRRRSDEGSLLNRSALRNPSPAGTWPAPSPLGEGC
jgi:hypothetical protein